MSLVELLSERLELELESARLFEELGDLKRRHEKTAGELEALLHGAEAGDFETEAQKERGRRRVVELTADSKGEPWQRMTYAT